MEIKCDEIGPIGSIEFHRKRHGINLFVAAFFIVAQMAGGGIVALPTAMIQSGIIPGVLLIVVLTLMTMSTSIMLGKCWVLLRRRWPTVYRDKHCHEPYPEICERALGKKFRRIANICVLLNQFSIAVVFLLLSSKNIHQFLKVFTGVNLSFCLLIIAIGILLFPATLLKSPEDFGWAGVLSACTTSAAALLICIGALMDFPTCAPHANYKVPISPTNYFLALGTILFSFGGHSGFPTTQHDMKKPENFTKSSLLAFIVLTLLFLPVCLLAYFVYGNSLRESVISSLQHVWLQQLSNSFITGHAIFSIIITLNPISQAAEKLFDVPSNFGIQRILVRAIVMGMAIFVAESVPTFGPLLDLSGGSTQSSMSLIFPPICYLFLNAAEKKMEMRGAWLNKADKKIERHIESFQQMATISDVVNFSDRKMLFVCTLISGFGILGGFAATFSAIRTLTYTHFVPPCYISAFTSASTNEDGIQMVGPVNCCGAFQNISIYGQNEHFCSRADLDFYE